MYSDNLFIHIDKYDKALSKSKLWAGMQIPRGSFQTVMDFKNLSAIYCYKDGYVRFLFCDNVGKRTVYEFYSRCFEEYLNEAVESLL